MSEERSRLIFRGGEQTLIVQGSVEVVAKELRSSGPVRLTAESGEVVFVNWANVLYVDDPRASSVSAP